MCSVGAKEKYHHLLSLSNHLYKNENNLNSPSESIENQPGQTLLPKSIAVSGVLSERSENTLIHDKNALQRNNHVFDTSEYIKCPQKMLISKVTDSKYKQKRIDNLGFICEIIKDIFSTQLTPSLFLKALIKRIIKNYLPNTAPDSIEIYLMDIVLLCPE